MHVDPYHALKFSTYLCDTSAENGALQVIPGSAWIGKRIRNENSIEALLNSDLYTFEKSKYYSKDLEEKRIFVEANAGDLLILDTDVIHCGGIIQKSGLERMTLIYHNRK
jgi:ectoine hydroxylase-related dioxygenase (phytanoyl-CoA dioxygenase family)